MSPEFAYSKMKSLFGVSFSNQVVEQPAGTVGEPQHVLLAEHNVYAVAPAPAAQTQASAVPMAAPQSSSPGKTLSEVTADLAQHLGIRHPLLPMSDDPIRTTVETDAGRFAFQEYFVRERWQPVVRRIEFA